LLRFAARAYDARMQTSHTNGLLVTEMQPDDWRAVRDIYAEGIATGDATFEPEPPSWEKWDSGHLPVCRLVARSSGEVLGWVALSRVSDRCVYGGVAEVSLYVRAAARRQGVGKVLIQALIKASEAADIWTLQGGVFPENAASIGVLKRCGFREVGRRERLGQMNGDWRDVLLFERRSDTVGR
jgi:phosphinothricin acetyltransferase